MTATNTTESEQRDVLETILATVESIGRNVEEILDQLTDHLAEMRYGGWREDRCLGEDEYD